MSTILGDILTFNGGSGSDNGEDALDVFLTDGISGTYENSRVTKLRTCAFAYCSNLSSIEFPVCTTIGSSAFNMCTKLLMVNFPVCTTINSSAFNMCTSIVWMNFPACTTIGPGAFSECRAIAMIHFPVCSSIDYNAFNYCGQLATAEFPKCTYISTGVFKSDFKLSRLYLLNSVIASLANTYAFASTPISNYTKSTNGVYGSIYVKTSLLTSWKTATNWATFSSRFVGYQ